MNTTDEVISDNGKRPKPRTWIFQANPNKYRIEDSLKIETEEFWNLNQHAKKIHTGDRVLVWISGPDAGIYAVGTVMTEPMEMPDSLEGLDYWHKRRDGLRVKPRVRVRYNLWLLDNPLLKVFLRNDPDLWDLKILRSPRGTNFPITETEWQAIKGWLNSAQYETDLD